MNGKEISHVDIEGRSLRISNLDKVLYPATGTTKGEVLQYYVHIARLILPQLADRPVTRIRWPHGVQHDHFFEKNLPSGAPDWLARVVIEGHGSRSGGSVTYPLVGDVATLVYLVNLGSLEIHSPQWRVDELGVAQNPDRLVIDLDPGPGAGLRECATVALAVREVLLSAGLASWPVTSGSKGMQMYAELDGLRSSDDVSSVAKSLAIHLSQEHPGLVVSRMTKSLRDGKIFLDWSQNSAAKTTITPWSLRGRQRPQVACPRQWGEIEDAESGAQPLAQVSLAQALDRAEESAAN